MSAPSLAVRDKADRYLTEGRVAVDVADWSQGMVSALVQGNRPEPYHVMHTRVLGWRCNCWASTECCHIVAVRRVFPDQVTTRAAS